MGTATAKAMMVWPEGKEKRSGGKSVAQQCGSVTHGRSRPVKRFTRKNTAHPAAAEISPVSRARNRRGPPKNNNARPKAIHSPPSPARDDAIIHTRNHRGGAH